MGSMMGHGAMKSFRQDASVVKQQVRRGTTRRTLRFAQPYRWQLLAFLLVVLLDATVAVINPLLARAIINQGILKSNAPLVVHLALLIGAVGVVAGLIGLLQTYLASTIGAGIVLSLRTRLFEHIQQMPLAFFTRTQTGALVTRLNNDVNGARSAFTDVLSNVVGNFARVVMVLIVMFALSWRITLGALILVPIILLPVRFWGRGLQKIVRESLGLAAEMNTLMVERFNAAGALLAKLFGQQSSENDIFEQKAKRVSDISVKQALYSRVFFTALMMLATVATALAYGWGGLLAVRHVLDVGTVVALVAYLMQLYTPLLGLSNAQVSIMTALVSFDRVFEVLDLPPMIEEKPDAVEIPAGPLRVDFESVSFSYPVASEVSLASLEAVAMPDQQGHKDVLREVSFTIEPGQMVALVGPSGAGKTTITQLIPRLYDVNSGSIQINGVDVRDLRMNSLRERIGVVTQDAHLFHESIRANLLYARPGATDEQLWAAIRDAQIEPLLRSLPDGLDTMVGERGYRFSGGEKQRLALARILLKAPDLVILDEATAHLDSESEAAVQRALETALRGRTSVVIAHRLSTVRNADMILVVHQGKIVERGPHAQLLQQSGLYADLYQRQFASPEEALS